ncbi:MAG: hypothetical protein GEU90_08830 [Gemmatimonas sp.]|nr:hypothetical protein [Gemmatimonas sp.]
MKTKRTSVLTIVALGSFASPIAAQFVPREPQSAGLPTEPLEEARPATGFGRSGALRVVLIEPGQPVDATMLASVGDGWELGHSWTLLHGSMVQSPILGDAARTAPGDQTTDVGGAETTTAASMGGLTGAEAAPSNGDPDDDQPSGPAVLGVPAPGAVVAEAVVAPEESVADAVVGPVESGVWRLESQTGATATIIAMAPASLQRDGHLNGYEIGEYPTQGAQRTDAYAPPVAFIEVTPDNQDLGISDHLTLGQFLTKNQFDVWPKYVALNLQLIDKLELVMNELNAMGIRAESLHVMSGFRTPRYNGPGGDGRAALSRHMWGDAADVWIDNDQDGQMDDLNGDGRIDLNDAGVMMRAVERVEGRFPELVGGAGTYPTTDTHGPYIHIDTRGNRSRW